jgi:4-amino-4-deoxy-L-arabinose transferase-like glycosyltransferase
VAALIVALLTLPRLLSLENAPYHVALDEAIHPLYGLEMLRQRPWDIAAGTSWYFGTPFLTQALQAWPCLVFEPLFGARLASLILGLASLVSTYALAGRMFGNRTAVVAVTVLACSYWHIAYSRMAHPYMEAILMLTLVLHVLLFGVAERNRFLQFIAGVLLAASLLVYTPARVVIPILILWLAHGLLVRCVRIGEAAADAAAIALGAAIFLSPYLHAQGVRGILARYQETTMGAQGPLHLLIAIGWTSPAAMRVLATQLQTAVRVYYTGGAWMAVDDWAPAALLDPVSLALALMGLGIAAAGLRDSNRFLLVVWIAITFISGQLLTDVPRAAYRAAPLLPALAICAGLAVNQLASALRRWQPAQNRYVEISGLLVLVALVLPFNLAALNAYLRAHSRDPGTGMARLIGAGGTAPIYYLVASGSMASFPPLQLLSSGRSVRDVASLMDTLGTEIEPKRDAVFVLDPGMAAAATAIRRCYPGAMPISGPYPPGPQPVLGWSVSQPAIAAGRNCAVAPDGPGLRARYFSDENWDGELRRERVEDWPVHWITTEEAKRFRSIEWSGWLRLPISGEYRFQFLTGGTRGSASVGEQLHIDPEANAGARFDEGRYPVRLRCQTRPGALCWLRWAPPGGEFDAIPSELFSPGATIGDDMALIPMERHSEPFAGVPVTRSSQALLPGDRLD